MIKRTILLAGLLFSPLFALPALGCVCVLTPNATPEVIRAERAAAFQKATAIFVGEVVSLDRFTVRFKVEKIWKGAESKEIKMLTGVKDNGNGTYTTTSCDYSFRQGQKYLVYAYGPYDQLKTHVCTRTAQLEYAEVEMNGLDESTPHRNVGDNPEQEGNGSNPPEAKSNIRVQQTRTTAVLMKAQVRARR